MTRTTQVEWHPDRPFFHSGGVVPKGCRGFQERNLFLCSFAYPHIHQLYPETDTKDGIWTEEVREGERAEDLLPGEG